MAAFHVVATTVARDALTGLATDDLVLNKETGETTRWDGAKHVLTIDRISGSLNAMAFGAVPDTPRIANPTVNSRGAINAMLLEATAGVNAGKVASASNNDDRHVSLAKDLSTPSFTAGEYATVGDSGTLTSVGTETCADTTKSWSRMDLWATAILRMTSGAARGQCVNVTGSTVGGTMNFAAQRFDPANAPAVGDSYQLIKTRDQPEWSTNDAGLAFELAIVDGKGRGYWGIIVKNTAEMAATSITRSGTTATVTTGAAHGLSTGALATILGANQAAYNITGAVTVVDSTHFTYQVAGSPATPATGTIKLGARLWLDRPFASNQIPDSTSRFKILPARCVQLRYQEKPCVIPSQVFLVDTREEGHLDGFAGMRGPVLRGAGSQVSTHLVIRGGQAMQLCTNVSVTDTTLTDSSKSWVPNQWKGRWLVCWTPQFARAVFVKILHNTSTQLTLSQATWPSQFVGTISQIISQRRFRSSGFNPTGDYDGYRWYKARITPSGGAQESRYITSSRPDGGNTDEFIVDSNYTGTVVVGDNLIVDGGPSANWYYAICEPYALELNGTTNHNVEHLTVAGESGSEFMNLLGVTWRRPYFTGGNDFRGDSRRVARSSSDNSHVDLNVEGDWIDCGIVVGNTVDGGGFNQVDTTRWLSPRVAGKLDNSVPDTWHHWWNGIFCGANQFGNNLAHGLRSPTVFGVGNGIVNAYSDLRVSGEGIVQSNINDFYVLGTANFTLIEGIRSENSQRLYMAPAENAPSQRVTLRGIGFKQDSSNRFAGDGHMIWSQLQGDLRIQDVHADSGFSSPNDGTIASVPAANQFTANVSDLTFPIVSGQYDGTGHVVVLKEAGGVATGQYRTISSVTVAAGVATFTISANWTDTPPANTKFEIVELAFAPVVGTFADSSDFNWIKIWYNINGTHIPGRYRNKRLIVTSGAAKGGSARVLNNSRDRLYCEWSAGTIASGDGFIITQGRHVSILSRAGYGLIEVAGFSTYSPKNRLIYHEQGLVETRVRSYDRHNRLNQVVESWHGDSRFDVDGWFRDNIGTGLTNQTLTRLGSPSFAPNAWIAKEAGHILGFWIKSSTPRTGGTLRVKVFKNGTEMGSTIPFTVAPTVEAVIDGTNPTFARYRAAGWMDLEFAAGDEIDMRISTDGAWSPTTADIRGGISVEVDR